MAGAGRWITSLRTSPSDVTLPAATDPAPDFPKGLDGKVDGISKLQRIHENSGNNHIIRCARSGDEREMARVQISHGRHQRDRLAATPVLR